jgi:hypothetical protein
MIVSHQRGRRTGGGRIRRNDNCSLQLQVSTRGAPANLRPWGGGPSTRIVVAQLQVASDCSDSGPGRRIGDGGSLGALLQRRHCAAQGGDVRGDGG